MIRLMNLSMKKNFLIIYKIYLSHIYLYKIKKEFNQMENQFITIIILKKIKKI
jgi:hypothetical protein